MFEARPNRFTALVRTDRGLLKCHCPNPGRLREILTPGAEVILELPQEPRTVHPPAERSTVASLAAVNHRGLWIPMASARANQAAGLYLHHSYPGAKIQPEYTMGKSRFDYRILTPDGREILTEVKACTLEHSRAAMFPDAPSLRAVKHLEHLAHLAEEGRDARVLFVTYFPQAESFIPHLHTDPEFARAALALQGKVRFQAQVWQAQESGSAVLVKEDLPVDLSGLEGLDYTTGLPLAAWEGESETVFVWGRDFKVWQKALSQRAKVRTLLEPDFPLRKVNDLRVYSHSSLDARWARESEDRLRGLWQDRGSYRELRVPGRPLDTQEFWQWFLAYRHRFWLS